MPSAAMSRLYKSTRTGRTREWDSLHNHDIKALAAVLRNYTFKTFAHEKKYWQDVKKQIRDLPLPLRSPAIHLTATGDKDGHVKPGQLCHGHRGLNHVLLHEIWEWISHEFDKAIGPFLYPIIMNAGLPHRLELKARQLEPVLQMWHSEFSGTCATPEGREPLRPGHVDNGVFVPKWAFQENKCVACMLSRIGSDCDVLFALFAGMVGRFKESKIGTKDSLKSKRLRFVRYWLKKFEEGDPAVGEAWNLGVEMRRVRKVWKTHVQGSQLFDFYGRKHVSRQTVSASELKRDSGIGFDISEPYNPDVHRKGQSRSPKTPSVALTQRSSSSTAIHVDISDPHLPPLNPAIPEMPFTGSNRSSSAYSISTTSTFTLSQSHANPGAKPIESLARWRKLSSEPDPPRHTVASSRPMTPNSQPSVRSQTGELGMEWESDYSDDELSTPVYTRSSCLPAPLRACSIPSQAPSAPSSIATIWPNCGTSVYNVPPPHWQSVYSGLGPVEHEQSSCSEGGGEPNDIPTGMQGVVSEVIEVGEVQMRRQGATAATKWSG